MPDANFIFARYMSGHITLAEAVAAFITLCLTRDKPN